MASYVDFDPKKHKGRQLYELQTKEEDNLAFTVPIPVDTSFKQASKTPWYYVVEAEK
jgi:hypothetical protein